MEGGTLEDGTLCVHVAYHYMEKGLTYSAQPREKDLEQMVEGMTRHSFPWSSETFAHDKSYPSVEKAAAGVSSGWSSSGG